MINNDILKTSTYVYLFSIEDVFRPKSSSIENEILMMFIPKHM